MRYPDVPPELDDRAQDGWEPLLAIAESAGQLAQARRAAVALHTSGDRDDPSLGVRLLADLRAVFGDADRMTTAELVGKLNALEESPWGGFGDAGMTARVLARMLRPYGVSPKKIRVGDESVRGYERVTFCDAWERYTRPGSPSGPEEAEQAEQCRSDPESHVEQSESVFHMKSPADQACSGVPT